MSFYLQKTIDGVTYTTYPNTTYHPAPLPSYENGFYLLNTENGEYRVTYPTTYHPAPPVSTLYRCPAYYGASALQLPLLQPSQAYYGAANAPFYFPFTPPTPGTPTFYTASYSSPVKSPAIDSAARLSLSFIQTSTPERPRTRFEFSPLAPRHIDMDDKTKQ